MQLDRDAFMAAFERVAERLAMPPYNYATTGDAYASLPFLREIKYGSLPATLEELFAENLDDDPIANFITLLVVGELSPATPKRREPALHLRAERGGPGFTFFSGDLEVAGNFAYEHSVMIAGKLVVGGLIEDRFEGAALLVSGDVIAKGLFIGSETKIGGTLRVSDALVLRRTRGGSTLLVERGATTKLFAWTPDDSSWSGELDAELRVRAHPPPGDLELARLCSLVEPALANQLVAAPDELRPLVDRLREGAAIWR